MKLRYEITDNLLRHGQTAAGQHTTALAFKDLCVFAKDKSICSGTAFFPTVGSALNPVDWFRGLYRGKNASTKRLLSGFEGVVNPGEMLRKLLTLLICMLLSLF